MTRNLTRTIIISALVASAVLIGTPALAGGHHGLGHHGNHRSVVVVTGSAHHRDDRHYRRERRHERRYGSRHNNGHHYVERARRYASQATAQASTAWRLGCRHSGPRWSSDWNDHYTWALNASPGELRHETNRRDDRLQDCRARHYHSGSYRHHRPHH